MEAGEVIRRIRYMTARAFWAMGEALFAIGDWIRNQR
jgi:hypothetical protein